MVNERAVSRGIDGRCRSDIEQCLWTAAEATQHETRILFIGDSRVRELFHEFVDTIIGSPRTYVRTHTHQLVTVDRLRLRAVSTSFYTVRIYT